MSVGLLFSEWLRLVFQVVACLKKRIQVLFCAVTQSWSVSFTFPYTTVLNDEWQSSWTTDPPISYWLPSSYTSSTPWTLLQSHKPSFSPHAHAYAGSLQTQHEQETGLIAAVCRVLSKISRDTHRRTAQGPPAHPQREQSIVVREICRWREEMRWILKQVGEERRLNAALFKFRNSASKWRHNCSFVEQNIRRSALLLFSYFINSGPYTDTALC